MRLPSMLPLCGSFRRFATHSKSPFQRRSSLAAFSELFLFDGENSPFFHIDIAHNAYTAGLVGNLYVITSRIYASDSQAFVVIDGAVTIVFALISSPNFLAHWRHLERRNGVNSQIPKANRLVLGLRSGIHK